MSTEENKALARSSFEEILNNVNLAIIDEVFSPNYVLHTPAGPVHGPEGFKQFVLMYRNAFPDARYTLEEMIAEGDKVVTRLTLSGTQHRAFMGIPATSKYATVSDIEIFRIAGGKAVETWVQVDYLGLLQQLGAIPPMR